jgi:DNA-binding response OmpR family regulator
MSSKIKEVLIVLNDEEEANALACALELAGHRAMTTWSGIAALQLVTSRQFDLVVVADYLPDLYVGLFLEKLNSWVPSSCTISITQETNRATTLTRILDSLGGASDPRG